MQTREKQVGKEKHTQKKVKTQDAYIWLDMDILWEKFY